MSDVLVSMPCEGESEIIPPTQCASPCENILSFASGLKQLWFFLLPGKFLLLLRKSFDSRFSALQRLWD